MSKEKEAEKMEALLEDSEDSDLTVGFHAQAGKIADELKELNKNLKEASMASSNLASVLNKLTSWGLWIAALGVAAAFANLIVDYLALAFPLRGP